MCFLFTYAKFYCNQTRKILRMADDEGKIKLFDSDEEADEEENNHDDFKIRPEYQGPHGLEMLEMNSQLSKRFKLDERFAEDFEPKDFMKVAEENESSEVIEEKKKNMRILESVLGHEVSKPVKPIDKGFSKKQLIRFDPEDENASKYIKISENLKEKPKKSKKKKEVVEEKPEDVIPISTERYIEVAPNLKEILDSSTPFSFSQSFNFEHHEATLDSKNDTSSKSPEEMEIQEDDKKLKGNKIIYEEHTPRFESSVQRSKYDRFFITEDDPRLKEGIEFFKRPKPLEELRVEWHRRRDNIMELFRQKKRSSQRSYTTKVQTVQKQNMIRRNNFQK